MITANMSLNPSKMGSCGRLIDCCDVKIDNMDENGEGEIITKGDNIMLGYHNNPTETDKVLNDGWFRTGDIGKFDKDGYLYITGRIKNIIVLKNGKNIYPEEIEGYLYKIPYIKEVIVSSDSGAVGDEVSLKAEIFPNDERGEMDNISDIKAAISDGINEINKNLSYYKRVSNIKFRDEEFDKTTSKKIKRSNNNGR